MVARPVMAFFAVMPPARHPGQGPLFSFSFVLWHFVTCFIISFAFSFLNLSIGVFSCCLSALFSRIAPSRDRVTIFDCSLALIFSSSSISFSPGLVQSSKSALSSSSSLSQSAAQAHFADSVAGLAPVVGFCSSLGLASSPVGCVADCGESPSVFGRTGLGHFSLVPPDSD